MQIKASIIIVGDIPIEMTQSELPDLQGNSIYTLQNLPTEVATWAESVMVSSDDDATPAQHCGNV